MKLKLLLLTIIIALTCCLLETRAGVNLDVYHVMDYKIHYYDSDCLYKDEEVQIDKISNSKLLKMAREFTSKRQPYQARKIYLYLVEVDSSNFDYNFELGMNYQLETSDCGCCAIPYFERAIRHITRIKKVFEIYYYTANAMQFCERYDDAIEQYKLFSKYIVKKKARGEFLSEKIDEKIASCQLAKQQTNRFADRITIEILDSTINTSYSEYSAVTNSSDSILLFTNQSKANSSGQVNPRTNKYYEDMNIAFRENGNLTSPLKFSKSINYISNIPNSPSDDRVIWMSKNDSTLIFYKDQVLYYSTIYNNQWKQPSMFPREINMDTKQNSASMTADGNTIFFSSNEDAGLGGMDIYVSYKNADGIWSKGKNLGPKINTKKNEDCPNISQDGTTLFYSSQSNTIGGFDVFVTYSQDSLNWMTPENLGIPINSPGDDLYFNPNPESGKSYLSSARKGGFGGFDIYSCSFEKSDFSPYKNMLFNIRIDGSKSIDTSGAKLNYEWDFLDGNKKYGSKVDYSYSKPGKYKVILNIIDSLSLAIQEKEHVIDIDLSNRTYIIIESVDTVKVNIPIELDGSSSILKDDVIESFVWDFGDGTKENGIKSQHTFNKAGSYIVSMKVDKTKNNSINHEMLEFTKPQFYKRITVINE